MRGCGEFMPRSAMLYSNVTNAHDYALVDADSNASTCTGIVDVSGTFKTLTPEDAKRGALEVCNDGLYLKRGCAIFIR